MAKNGYTIVGCGPSLTNIDITIITHASSGPVALCNGAIFFSDKLDNIQWWVSDSNFVATDIFRQYYPRCNDRLFYSEQVAEALDKHGFYPPAPSSLPFRENPWFTEADLYSSKLRFIDGVYRGGASIVGCALQHAIQNNYTDIYLAGVDMAGNTSLSHPNKEIYKDGHWSFKTQILNKMIAQCIQNVYTLTPTLLDVEEWV